MRRNPDQSLPMTSAIGRISHVLNYIHDHLDVALSVDEIAKQSCWSRWQLQRVFQNEIGVSVGQYIRELRLSGAAEQLLDSKARSIDIAFAYGFSSEISFSRAFRQMFGISPRAYRKAGQRTGLRKPIALSPNSWHADWPGQFPFVDVRVESLAGFTLRGLATPIHGLFSAAPDFSQKVPALWQQMLSQFPLDSLMKFGVIDVTDDPTHLGKLTYWAAVNSQGAMAIDLKQQLDSQLAEVAIPSQTYAVVKHRGCVSSLPETLLWFLLHWLPQSGYRGIDGFELERYAPNYDSQHQDALMEYWLPIVKITN